MSQLQLESLRIVMQVKSNVESGSELFYKCCVRSLLQKVTPSIYASKVQNSSFSSAVTVFKYLHFCKVMLLPIKKIETNCRQVKLSYYLIIFRNDSTLYTYIVKKAEG